MCNDMFTLTFLQNNCAGSFNSLNCFTLPCLIQSDVISFNFMKINKIHSWHTNCLITILLLNSFIQKKFSWLKVVLLSKNKEFFLEVLLPSNYHYYSLLHLSQHHYNFNKLSELNDTHVMCARLCICVRIEFGFLDVGELKVRVLCGSIYKITKSHFLNWISFSSKFKL